MKIIFESQNKNPVTKEITTVLSVMNPSDEFLASLSGTDEEKMIQLANKDLPTGTPYEIVADSVISSDRTFRDAWEYVAGSDEKTSDDLSLDDQLKYNHITQEDYDASNG
jgi:hypothetical protein